MKFKVVSAVEQWVNGPKRVELVVTAHGVAEEGSVSTLVTRDPDMLAVLLPDAIVELEVHAAADEPAKKQVHGLFADEPTKKDRQDEVESEGEPEEGHEPDDDEDPEKETTADVHAAPKTPRPLAQPAGRRNR